MQINNIKIKYNQTWDRFVCYAPDGIYLKDFVLGKNAVKWAKSTLDFIKSKKNKLCY